MSNLAKGQTAWNKLFRELGLQVAPIKDLRDKQRKFDARRARIQIVEELDANASTSLWTLAGVNIGTNTDEDGVLSVRITDESPGAGQATVNLYKATGGGGGDLVATGSAANGAVATLAASNSSGLTGTVKLGTVGASESNDAHKLRVFPDWPARFNSTLDGSETDHAECLQANLSACSAVASALEATIAILVSALTVFLRSRWATFQQSGQTTPISRTVSDDGEGTITANYVGLLEDGRNNMSDETTPAEQFVQGSVVTSGAGSFDGENQGQGAMAAPSMEEWAEVGTITAVCVDGTVGSERFELTQRVTATGVSKRALSQLTPKKTYSDPVLGIRGALLTRTIERTAGSTTHLGVGGDWTITNESPTNTNDGVLYAKVITGVVDAAKFIVQLYSSPAYTTSSLVAESDEGAAASSPGLNARRSSRLTGISKLGSAPVAGNTGTYDLHTFRSENTNGRADKFTLAITATSRGEFQDRLAETFGYALNSDPSSPTIDDSYASAGTFPPYEVRDA